MPHNSLDDFMAFDHVIRVYDDGTYGDGPAGIHAPDIAMPSLDDDAHSILAEHEKAYCEQAERQGWTLEKGWTGQDSYHGVCMHSSEFIGGNLARHILETPGLWVAITVDMEDGSEPDGWALAYRPLKETE